LLSNTVELLISRVSKLGKLTANAYPHFFGSHRFQLGYRQAKSVQKLLDHSGPKIAILHKHDVSLLQLFTQ